MVFTFMPMLAFAEGEEADADPQVTEAIAEAAEAEAVEAEAVECSPKLVIKNPTKDFYNLKVEDFEIQNYDYNKEVKIGKIPVAI